MKFSLALVALAAALLAGCASTKIAQKKTVEIGGQTLEFGGVYEPANKYLSLSVNGDPMMNGSFPPFTPTLNINAEYRGLAVRAECYFGSVLGGMGGMGGIVASAVQSGLAKASDRCEMHVDGKRVESLYF